MELIDTGKCIVCKVFFLTITVLFLSSCESNTHKTALDSDATADQTENDPVIIPDDDSVADTDVDAYDDAPITDKRAHDVDLPDNCNTYNIGRNCLAPDECGACLICVKAKCQIGCLRDDDCAAYPGTLCNRKLARCLNVVASDGACNETNCPDGCCYAEKGFRELRCLQSPELTKCSVCDQGEVNMGEGYCVPAACSTTDTKCQDYNTYTGKTPACYECKGNELICYEDCNNPGCDCGTTLMPVNLRKCVAAGETCTKNDECCSNQPCIQGFCY